MRMKYVGIGLALGLTLAGCSGPGSEATPTEVIVVTHDSFYLPDDVVAAFEEESGYDVAFVAPGDAGILVNQLVLTKNNPLGDVVYGIDNTFASRAVSEGVIEPYAPAAPAAVDAAAYAFEGTAGLTAIDFSDVCINADLGWFADRGLEVPASLDDLTQPEYAGLLSVTNPATSSPGLAFLLATVSAYGDDWPEYWSALRENDVRVVAGWSEAYYVDFSGPSSGGDFPLVLSYASSPAFEVGDDGIAPTSALLDTCFRQVEYAGVLAGAENPDGAEAVIEWLLSDAVQESLPDSMYVYPVSSAVDIPQAWATHAMLADEPWELDASTIDINRNDYIREWTSVVID